MDQNQSCSSDWYGSGPMDEQCEVIGSDLGCLELEMQTKEGCVTEECCYSFQRVAVDMEEWPDGNGMKVLGDIVAMRRESVTLRVDCATVIDFSHEGLLIDAQWIDCRSNSNAVSGSQQFDVRDRDRWKETSKPEGSGRASKLNVKKQADKKSNSRKEKTRGRRETWRRRRMKVFQRDPVELSIEGYRDNDSVKNFHVGKKCHGGIMKMCGRRGKWNRKKRKGQSQDLVEEPTERNRNMEECMEMRRWVAVG